MKTAGRPKQFESLRQTTVMLERKHVERLRELGRGNISEGLRIVVDFYLQHKREAENEN